MPPFLPCVLPIGLSLHFGWISCATLVNTNGYISSVAGRANRLKLVASVLSVVLAVLLGAAISLTREDPVYAAVIAWALWAVGSKAGWKGLEVGAEGSHSVCKCSHRRWCSFKYCVA